RTLTAAPPLDYFASLEESAQDFADTISVASTSTDGTRLEPLAGHAIANAAGVLRFVAEGDGGESISAKKLSDTQASILTAVAYDAFDDFAVATQNAAAGTPLAKTSAFVAA